jgi:hypothetical protein
MKAGRRQRPNLMAPGMRGFGKSVAEQHQRPLAGFEDAHPQRCGFDRAVLHPGLLKRCGRPDEPAAGEMESLIPYLFALQKLAPQQAEVNTP